MIKVLKSGFFTSVQDSGRFGYRNYGVPVSGAMDMIAYNYGNRLLNNLKNAASLEITMTGPSLLFETASVIAITGAEMSPKINDVAVSNNEVLRIQEGDVLSFGKLEKGFRTYLSVAGGFKTAIVMESRSFMKNVTVSESLKQNDTLPIDEFTKGIVQPDINFDPTYFNTDTLQLLKGPDFEMLSKDQLDQILQTEFSVSKENNRMGYQLNEEIEAHQHSMITSAVIPGTVQLTPKGKLIILMRNGQTTGGYLRILQLTEHSISVLAQKKRNEKLRFVL
ncbi:biotin-dependent carboxyltransferase family protein [Ascidiimonas sp. W6]|uniref:5-oxoprolinase subunit C family protein n=1 Tax=Ascidiimonas meishanensis TaxID=3128903 RepID=UPI0030ED6D69